MYVGRKKGNAGPQMTEVLYQVCNALGGTERAGEGGVTAWNFFW